MKRTIAITLIVFGAPAFFRIVAAEGEVVSLDRLIETVEADLPGLHARLSRAGARELAAKALPRWYKPELGLELGGGGTSNGSETRAGPLARIVARWTFWDGGRRAGRGAMAETQAEIAREEANLYRYDLRLQLARRYYRLAEIAELSRINADESRRLLRLKRLLYPRIRIGSLGYSEATGLDLRRGELKNEQRALDGERDRIMEELRILRGGANRSLPAVLAIFSRSLPGAPQVSAPGEPTPQLRLARLRARLGRSAADLARRELYWPSLGMEVFGGYQPYRDAIDPAQPELGAGLTIRLPIMGGTDRSALLESARRRSAADRMDAEQALRENRIHRQNLIRILEESRERARDLKALARRARDNLRQAFGEFAGGLKAPADMREAIRLHADLERRRATAFRRALLARFEIDLPAALRRAAPAANEASEARTD